MGDEGRVPGGCGVDRDSSPAVPKSRSVLIGLHSFSGFLELFRLLDKDQNGIVQLSLAEVSSFGKLFACGT